MKAIARIEQLLSGAELTPITRLETYIASLNGQNIITPPPVTREEQILSGQHLTPVTRKEAFMLYGMGNLDSVPAPITREEYFWYNWSASTETEVKVSGILPLRLTNSVGANLVDWLIEGDTVQNKGVGDYDVLTGMYKVPMLSRGKNLWINNEPTRIALFIKSGTTVTASSNIYTTIIYYDKDGNQIDYWTMREQTADGRWYKAFVLIADAYYFAFGGDSTGNYQIEIGSTATEYEPYRQPIVTPVYIPSPLMKNEIMRSNGTITRADGTMEFFETTTIGTLDGECWIDVDTEVRPPYAEVTYLAKDDPWIFVLYTFNGNKYVINGDVYGFRTRKDKVDTEFQAELLSIMEGLT